MSKLITDYISDIHGKNINLLDVCRNEGWSDFILLLEDYIISIDDFFDFISKDSELHLDDAVKKIIQEIIINESEITRKLEGRISMLSDKMKSLVRGGDFLKLYYH